MNITIKLSADEKQKLITIKKKTKIDNWNVICRWALCASLSESSLPPNETLTSDSNIEMSWKVFTSGLDEIYSSLIVMRAMQQCVDVSDKEKLTRYVRLHIKRGISYINSNKKISESGLSALIT